MKKKSTVLEKKATALYVGLVLIALFGAASFLWPDRIAALAPVLTAIVTLVSAYIGLQVANNGVKGKFFNSDLYNAENGEGEFLIVGKSESGRVLVNALYNFALSYENHIMSKWLADKKPGDFQN